MTDKRIFSIIGRKGYYSGNTPSSIAKKYILKHGNQNLTQFSIKDSSKNKIYSYEGKIIQQNGGKNLKVLINRIKGGNPLVGSKQLPLKINNSDDRIDKILLEIVNGKRNITNIKINHQTIDGISFDGKIKVNDEFIVYESSFTPMKKSEFVESMNFCPYSEESKCTKSETICFRNTAKCKQVRKGMTYETYSLFSRKLQQSYNPLTNYLGDLLLKQWTPEQVKKYLEDNSFFVIGKIDNEGNVEPYLFKNDDDEFKFYCYAFVKFSSKMGVTYMEIPYIIKISEDLVIYISEQTPESNYYFKIVKQSLNSIQTYDKIFQLINLLKNDLSYENIINSLVSNEIIKQLKQLKKTYNIGLLKAPAAQLLYPYYLKVEALQTVYNKINHQSYNIAGISNVNKNLDNITLIPSDKFARGNIFLYREPTFMKLNPKQILVNCLEVSYPGINNSIIKSFRYGTQLISKKPKDDDVLKYVRQCNAIKKYIGGRTAIVISLGDFYTTKYGIRFVVKTYDWKKNEETKLVTTELNEYIKEKNIIFFNMAINIIVNLTVSSLGKSEEFKSLVDENFGRLDELIKTITQKNNSNTNLLKKLYESFIEYFKYNIYQNDIPPDLKEIVKLEKDGFNLSNENCRLIMFVFISLIFYMISVIEKDKYVLLYHCKSGQDRTGTLYALNQMVNEITTKNFGNISDDIKKSNNLNFVTDIYKKYYSPFTNEEIYTSYAKFLLFSYNLTYIGSAFPGLKWSLDSEKFSNKFPYLMLKTIEDAKKFDGASSCRGS